MGVNGERYIWRLNQRDYVRYNRLAKKLLDEEEWSESFLILLDEIKSLPGFPSRINPDVDILDVRLADVPWVGFTG